MKNFVTVLSILFLVLLGCKTAEKTMVSDKNPIKSDTIRIANDELEYEILIIDPGFSGWFNSYAKPRNFHSQSYMENRNRAWVTEWNSRAIQNTRYNGNLYEMQINYQPGINYGYEVNYMLYNYLTYFQLTNKIQLGSYPARI